MRRAVRRSALMLTALVVCSVLGSPAAMAAELDDHLWVSRPLLVFAPTNNDPRLLETLGRIEADQCGFVARDMVLGRVVTGGTSTLDGHAVSPDHAQQLADRYSIGETDFNVVLVGKDGTEKYRVNEVPDLRTVFAVIDGMPMRSRELGADPSRC